MARLGGEEFDDVLDGFAGLVIGGVAAGSVVEADVGERAAEPLVKGQEQKSDLHAFGGAQAGIAATVAFEQWVASRS